MDAGQIAAGGGAAGGAAIDAGSPGTITVEGTVITNKGVLVSSATVAIPGKLPVTTGAGGRFTIPDVRPPYDIVILSGVTSHATIYRGVTRANPRLQLLDGASTSNSSTAPIQLTYGGTLLPSSPSATWFVNRSLRVNASDVASSMGVAQWVGTSNTLAFDFSWWTTGAVDLSVAGLQVLHDPQTKAPIDFTFGLNPSVPVVANATIPVSLNMGPVTSSVLNATVNVPAGFSIEAVSTFAKSGGHLFRVFDSNTANVGIKVPNLPQPGFAIDVVGRDNAGNYVHTFADGLTAGGTFNTVNLPQSPRLSLPIQNAAGIDVQTQSFSWIPVGPGSVSIVTIATPNLSIDVVTFDSRTQLPSLADLGLGTIPTGTIVNWWVTAVITPGSMDGLTDPARPKLDTFGPWTAQTTERTFTAR